MTVDDIILEKIREMSDVLNAHISETKNDSPMLKKLYEYMLVSNGALSFAERLRNTEKWQAGEKYFLGILAVFIFMDIASRLWLAAYPK